jgi:hypothetical protein
MILLQGPPTHLLTDKFYGDPAELIQHGGQAHHAMWRSEQL